LLLLFFAGVLNCVFVFCEFIDFDLSMSFNEGFDGTLNEERSSDTVFLRFLSTPGIFVEERFVPSNFVKVAPVFFRRDKFCNSAEEGFSLGGEWVVDFGDLMVFGESRDCGSDVPLCIEMSDVKDEASSQNQVRGELLDFGVFTRLVN
jgi:hypothetical protein